MSSSRFPGKVLAPFRGRPLIAHVLDRVAQTVPADHIVVATSTSSTDDPLSSYVRELGFGVFRGPLDDVFQRFQLCLNEHRCEWFFRVCADSPLLDHALLAAALSRARDVDLVTNVHPRTFPRGRSVELVRSDPFARIDPEHLTPEQKEHVTRPYYERPGDYRILNFESGDPSLARVSLAIDTLDDLRRLEAAPNQ